MKTRFTGDLSLLEKDIEHLRRHLVLRIERLEHAIERIEARLDALARDTEIGPSLALNERGGYG